MVRIRIEIKKNERLPSRDLEVASSLRRDLWAHSPIEIEVDDQAIGTRRDENGTAYFEFETSFPEEVRRVVDDYSYADHVTIKELEPNTTQPSES